MPFVDVTSLRVVERLPGWHGRYFHSPSMTFAHYDFVRGASIHEHDHPQEEVYEVIEGELEVTIDGVAQIARPGIVAIVPGGARHSIKVSATAAPSSWTIPCGPSSDPRRSAHHPACLQRCRRKASLAYPSVSPMEP